MEQRQLDDLEPFPEDNIQEEEMLNDVNDIVSNVEDIKENEEVIEEKITKKNEIKIEAANLDEPKPAKKKAKKEVKKELKVNEEISKEETKETKETAPVNDPWADDEDEKIFKHGSTWKIIAGILVILLVFSIYTDGFNLTGAAVGEVSLSGAEDKALDYINNNLLQAPFTADLINSEELDNLYKLTINVAGQEIESYVTKDGNYLFPQGFDLNENLEEEASEVFEVSMDDDAVKGNLNAPVTIIEFSDFECPFCGKYVETTYPEIVKNYIDTGNVNYVFRDFPLDFHPDAQKAAEAAECAGEQEKYWEMHDLLFANQELLSVNDLKQYALDLSLDSEEFNSCLDSGEMAEEVQKDLQDGQAYGVTGTPAFFINGKLISGAQPYEAFEQEIEAALAEAGDVELSPVEEEPEVVPEPVEETVEEPTEVVLEEPEVVPEPVEEPTLTGKTVSLTMDAKKFRFIPNLVEVNQGDKVKLTLTSLDAEHSFELSAFGVSEVISVGAPVTVEFTASKVGTFNFNSKSHTAMVGTLIVN
ncbi:thioredoxin domain-containing protein [Candidatus Woesearchaeota archaeon]|nr:thioredoxin domain-containing protein [Candidatus Woesearchaeota archaeon]